MDRIQPFDQSASQKRHHIHLDYEKKYIDVYVRQYHCNFATILADIPQECYDFTVFVFFFFSRCDNRRQASVNAAAPRICFLATRYCFHVLLVIFVFRHGKNHPCTLPR